MCYTLKISTYIIPTFQNTIKIILLMIPNEKCWYYFAVKRLPTVLRGTT